ncbi:MAG: hypothetical protein E7667_00335 [Ruminococcaceae bacterium]|nr:hypothetical protein [Oscillospiraceae bacterium]
MSQENKNAKNSNVIQSIISKTQLPCDLLKGQFRLELRGNCELYACGCKKILEYSQENILLMAERFNLRILGENLTCASFHCRGIVIEGKIQEIGLESEK